MDRVMQINALNLYAAYANQYLLHLMARSVSPVTQYVMDRGLTEKDIRQWGIGYAFESQTLDLLREHGFSDHDLDSFRSDSGRDRFSSRLIFPLYSAAGELVGLAGRDWQGTRKAKYVNSPQSPLFNKSEIIYGLDRLENPSSVTIVEGYMDVITADKMAPQLNAVACMGTALTKTQLKILWQYGVREINLCFDRDFAGYLALARALTLLKQKQFRVKILEVSGGKDVDEALRSGDFSFAYGTQHLSYLAGHMARIPRELNDTQKSMVGNILYPHFNGNTRLMHQLAQRLELSETEIKKRFERRDGKNSLFKSYREK